MKGASPFSGEPFYQPLTSNNKNCYNAIKGKGCHVVGLEWLFGEYINQNIDVTEDEANFGKMYRKTYADLMKNKSSAVLASAYDGQWSKFNVGNKPQTTSRPMMAQCGLLTAMDAYGKF